MQRTTSTQPCPGCRSWSRSCVADIKCHPLIPMALQTTLSRCPMSMINGHVHARKACHFYGMLVWILGCDHTSHTWCINPHRTADMHDPEPERPSTAPDPRTARRTLLTTTASDCLDSRDPHHLKAALKQTLSTQSSIKAGSRHAERGDLTTRHLSTDSQGFGGACSSASQDSESEYLPFDAAIMPPIARYGAAIAQVDTHVLITTTCCCHTQNPSALLLHYRLAPQAPVQQQASQFLNKHADLLPKTCWQHFCGPAWW